MIHHGSQVTSVLGIKFGMFKFSVFQIFDKLTLLNYSLYLQAAKLPTLAEGNFSFPANIWSS